MNEELRAAVWALRELSVEYGIELGHLAHGANTMSKVEAASRAQQDAQAHLERLLSDLGADHD